jgi:succinoglycan biosynthesis transport protein ExoP
MSLDPASLQAGDPRSEASVEAGYTAAPPDFQFREMFQILRRRALLILAMAALGLLAALLITAKTKKMYSATATVEINPPIDLGPSFNDLSGLGANAAGDSEGVALELATQEAIINSGSVALAVVQQLNLAAAPPYSIPDDAKTNNSPLGRERGLPLSEAPLQQERVIQIFGQRLQIALVHDTRLLSITYTDPDPALAAKVANAVTAAYTAEYSKARLAASAQAFSGLTEQLADLKAQVFDNERKVSEYERKTGLVTPAITSQGASGSIVTGADTVSMTRFEELNRELTAAEVVRIAREEIYRMTLKNDPDLVLGAAASQLATNAGPSTVLAAGSSDLALLGSLREQRSRVSLQEAANLTKYGSKNPFLINLQNEAKELDKQIHGELVRIVDRARSDYDLAKANEDGLQAQVASQQQELTRVSGDANQLLVLEQEQLSSRQLYQDVYTKLEEARVAAGLRTSNVTAIDPARVSSAPSKPVPIRNVALGLAGGLALGVFFAFLLDMLDDSLDSAYKVHRATGISVLASVPPPGSTTSTTAWLLADPLSPISEAVRYLRGTLLVGSPGERPRTILFSGLSGGEGVSTLCFNTAVALALQGRTVLLIDANLRRPAQQALTGVTNTAGLSEYLADGLKLEQVVQPCPGIDRLSVLPSGHADLLSPELLGSPRFADLLVQTRAEYDLVVIDSSPLISAADVGVIGTMVDRAVVVLRAGSSKGELLEKALAQLHLKNSRLRLVLTGVPVRSANFHPGDVEHADF